MGYWRSAIIAACMAVSVGSAHARDLTTVEIVGEEAQHLLSLFLADIDACLNHDPDCSWYNGLDTDAEFTVEDQSGMGRLDTSSFPSGESGTPGEGLYPYLYTIDLADLFQMLPTSNCVREVRIPLSDLVPLDYDGDGELEDAFHPTIPGRPISDFASVRLEGTVLSIVFRDCFVPFYTLGVTSSRPSRLVRATIVDKNGNTQSVEARSSSVWSSTGMCVDPTNSDPLPISRSRS